MVEQAKMGVQQQDKGPSPEQMQHEQQMQRGDHEGNLALEREKQNTERTKAETEHVKAQSAQVKSQAEMAKAQAETQRHSENMNTEVQVAEHIAALPDDHMMRLLAALQALKGSSNGKRPSPNGSIGTGDAPNGSQGVMQ
jgi:thioredoxin-like negative regulator of GroEL